MGEDYNNFKTKGKSFVKKQLTKSRIINIFLITICAFFLGLFDLVNFKFDFERITSAKVWLTTIIYGFTYTIIYFVGLSENINNLIVNDITYNSEKKEVDLISAVHRGDEMSKFLYIHNRNTRIEVFKYEINCKIADLDNKANEQEQLDWHYYIKSLKEEKEGKEIPKGYCANRQKLMEQLDPKFIEEYIDTIKVDYDPILASELTTPFSKMKLGKSILKVNPNTEKSKLSIKRIFSYISFSMILGLLGFETLTTNEVLPMIFNIAKTLVMVGWTLFNGFSDGQLQFKQLEMAQLDSRFQILKEYVRYEKENNNYDVKNQSKVDYTEKNTL